MMAQASCPGDSEAENKHQLNSSIHAVIIGGLSALCGSPSHVITLKSGSYFHPKKWDRSSPALRNPEYPRAKAASAALTRRPDPGSEPSSLEPSPTTQHAASFPFSVLSEKGDSVLVCPMSPFFQVLGPRSQGSTIQLHEPS